MTKIKNRLHKWYSIQLPFIAKSNIWCCCNNVSCVTVRALLHYYYYYFIILTILILNCVNLGSRLSMQFTILVISQSVTIAYIQIPIEQPSLFQFPSLLAMKSRIKSRTYCTFCSFSNCMKVIDTIAFNYSFVFVCLLFFFALHCIATLILDLFVEFQMKKTITNALSMGSSIGADFHHECCLHCKL